VQSELDLEAIDAVFRVAGLVRNRRGKPAGITRQLRMERSTPEELSQVAGPSRVAANGAEWLAVPGWDKLGWLWHGFSTRRGGC